MYVCTLMHLSVYVCVCVCVSLYVCTLIQLCMYTLFCMYVYFVVCMYPYEYKDFVCTHVLTYLYYFTYK